MSKVDDVIDFWKNEPECDLDVRMMLQNLNDLELNTLADAVSGLSNMIRSEKSMREKIH
jgi:hypothetical protein